ncbi:peptidylprolyl isomerase [Flavobacterium suaedae]|uniref:Peptidylprolyl isomerase n=1 Tax=Flavobacterium suaedae TaxID=1767027 RepID=A0ABQ1K262_9FLAO|nr:trigger factor [Flavobacterium suaedae]GGB81791.1 peptidylprolyl isomerase [Flavobacterium suaedae]
MNITKEQVDALNAVVTVSITEEDYKPQVDKVLKDYRKNANIPGFRKGAVPMSLVQKQYGKAVLADEVNKLLQNSLNDYLKEEKIDILGNPLPKVDEGFDWDANDYTFEFELGLAPEFSVDLAAKNKIVKYDIVADDEMLNEQVERIQKQYGKLISKEEVEEGDDIKGVFFNEEEGINNEVTISTDIFKSKRASKKFIGKKVGDVVTVPTKGLFDDDHKLMEYLKVDHDKAHGLEINVDFKIEEINTTEPAELNQELFDKLFGEGVVTSVEDLKGKIKEDAEKQFAQQADQKYLNDVTEWLIEETKFELPAEFLKKWIQTAGENQLTPEQAEEEYAKSEKGLRYQLIENKVMTENDLQLNIDELKAYAGNIIRQQMAQFGQMDPTDEDVDNIVTRVLSNQDEVKRLSEQVMSQKMLELFNEKVKHKSKEITYNDFIKQIQG